MILLVTMTLGLSFARSSNRSRSQISGHPRTFAWRAVRLVLQGGFFR